MRTRQRTLAGVGVLLAIVALPVLLALAGVPTPAEVREAISYHQVSSRLILGLCAVVGWVAWVWLLTTFVLEVAEARARRVRGPRGRGRLFGAAVAPAVVMVMGLLRSHAAGASPSPAAVLAATSSPPAPGASDAATSAANGPSSYAYVVRPGDNLYDLAAALYGDGEAWPVIWHASSDVSDPRMVDVGQVLTIPAAGLTPSGKALLSAQTLAGQGPSAAETEVVVQPGDTLWSLSPDHDWEATWQLNEGRPEPGAATFHDPNLIYAGWSLDIPPVPEPAPATPSPPPPTASPSPPTTSLPSTPSSGNGKRADATPATPRFAQSGDRSAPAKRHETGRPTPEPVASPSPSRWALELVGLGSALAAAGLVAEVRRLRLRQRRARASGGGASPPIGASSALFARQASRADLDGLSLVDRAVRQLGVELRAAGRSDLFGALAEVRLSDTDLSLLTDEPPIPLARFDVTPHGWRLERASKEALPDPDELSPLPGLATVAGRPEDHELLLVDMEHAGPLAVSGDEAAARSVLRALASEWATAPWADHGQLIAVGVAEELASLDRVTVSDLASAIRVAERVRREADRVLTQTGTDTLAPSRRGELAGFEVSLTLVVVGPGQDGRLVEALVGRAGPGLAVAVASDVDAPLRFDARTGELVRRERKQRLAPAALAETTAAELGELLGPVDQSAPVAGADRPMDDEAPGAPELRLLGSPELAGGYGKTLTRRAKNLACLLALHPEGVLRSRVEEALSPVDSPFRHKSLYNAVTELRRALGPSEADQKVVMNGERLVLSKAVCCDWWRFVALSQREEPEAWAEALALVTDVPLLGFEDESWVIAGGWAITVADAVVELSLRLGEAQLSRGDAAGADAAARQGLRSWPGEERLYQLRLRAAQLSGNRRAAEQAMAELREQLARVSDGEDHPSAETERLYRAVGGRTNGADAQRPSSA